MFASRAQIWVLVRSLAMRSFETKLSVVPGRKCLGQVMADWVDILIWGVWVGTVDRSFLVVVGDV
jgi:hypothetical protein